MKEKNTFGDLALPLIVSLIPSIIYAIALKMRGNIENIWDYISFIFNIYIFSALIVIILYFLLKNCLMRKKYRKFEGEWIQIMRSSSFPRKVAICTLKYEGNAFHFDGTNYNDDDNTDVEFYSYMFIGNTHNSFFFITQAHPLGEPTKLFHGFGSVNIRNKEVSHVIEGEGYFYDVSSAYAGTGDKALQSYQIVRFDINLCKKIEEYRAKNSTQAENSIHDKMDKKKIKQMTRNDIKKYIEGIPYEVLFERYYKP